MPALPPYLPAKDAAFAAWIANFASLITASPATYGLMTSDATSIAAAAATWASAYALVTSPSTKTKTTVQAKNTARVSAQHVVRPYAQTISLNAGVSSSSKTALGVNPRTSTPTPITIPTTNPVLSINQAFSLQTVVRYRDATASPSVKSKPYGVTSVLVYAMTSATPITNPAVITFAQLSTKSPMLVNWTSADQGKTAYFAARWATKTGLLGPWSPIVSFVVA